MKLLQLPAQHGLSRSGFVESADACRMRSVPKPIRDRQESLFGFQICLSLVNRLKSGLAIRSFERPAMHFEVMSVPISITANR